MADDALAYLVEAFGHYTEADMRLFLDAAPAGSTPAASETGEGRSLEPAVFGGVVPSGLAEPGRAAWA